MSILDYSKEQLPASDLP